MVLLGSIARVALITVGRQTALRMEFVLIYSQVKVMVKHGFQSIYRLSSIKTILIAPMGPQQLDLKHVKAWPEDNLHKIV